MTVVADSDAQYGTPTMVWRATHGVKTVIPKLKEFLTMKVRDASRRTNLLLNLLQ